MNLIFSSSTSEYVPLSFEGNYLYENYSRVNSFIRSKLDQEESVLLAKPQVLTGRVDWYSKFNGPMRPISEFPESHQKEIENKYVALLKHVSDLTHELSIKKDTESKQWSDLLNAIFRIEDNFLITNGHDWSIIWGWKFHNQLRYAIPDFPFSAPPIEVIEAATEGNTVPSEPITTPEKKPEPIFIFREEINPKTIETPGLRREPIAKTYVGFWTRIKHILRWLAYRFWGVVLLLLFLFLLCLLCRTCDMRAHHDTIIQDELNKLEQRLDERCLNTDTIK